MIQADIRTTVIGEVEEAARSFGVSPRTLSPLVLLHLPRFDAPDLHSPGIIHGEVSRLAEKVFCLQKDHREWTQRARIRGLSRSEMRLDQPSGEVARAIHESFHYLGSARSGDHFGLYHKDGPPDLPMSLATLSPLDVAHLREKLPQTGGPIGAWILSRVYAFDWAPRNSISALLGLMCRALRRPKSGAVVIFTYVNPNLGFAGSSYRAANWHEDGVKPITYRYFRGDYISARQAMALPPEAITCARHLLEPLRIWRYNWLTE